MNKKNLLDRIYQFPSPFLPKNFSGENEVMVACAISLKRNVQNFRFPAAAEEDELQQLDRMVKEALQLSGILNDEVLEIDGKNLSVNEAHLLEERHLISTSFASCPKNKTVFIDGEEKFTLAVNDSDHLRWDIFRYGVPLKKMWRELNRLDDRLNSHLEFAFDDTLGYLTASPADIGSGLRLTAFLHLPALSICDGFENDLAGLQELNLEITTLADNSADRCVFQLCNRFASGESEENMIASMEKIVRRLINLEKLVRRKFMEESPAELLDHIGRAFGKLRYSHQISEAEAIEAISWLHLGVTLEVFKSVDIEKIRQLIHKIPASCIMRGLGGEASASECDIRRAAVCREILN